MMSLPRYVSPEMLVKLFPFFNLGSLANDRWRRRGLKYYKIRRKILYKIEDVEEYLNTHQVLTIDQRD